MKKIIKVIGKIFRGIVIGLVVIVVGLVINNRIYYVKYSSHDVTCDTPLESEISEAYDVLLWLDEKGSKIFDGFDGNVDLILFNQAYEFLFTNEDYAGWETISYMNNGKKICRRKAHDPQAFATKIGDTWAGSFHTYDYFNCSLLKQMPIFIPPQVFTYDQIGYRSIIVHEMVHAYQGKCDYKRVDQAEHISRVGERFEQNELFNRLIEQEGLLLEQAIHSEEDEIPLICSFLAVRDERRQKCGMSDEEIENEKEYEWLEGCARYGEYVSSEGTKCMISKGLGNISEKVKTRAEDRFYTLGMAEILLIKKMDLSNWQDKLLREGFTPEALLRQYVQ